MHGIRYYKFFLILVMLVTPYASAMDDATNAETSSCCSCAWLTERLYESWFYDNFHVVSPGQLYRSATLTAARLEHYITQGPHIKTVVNLRNCQPNAQWYQDEEGICREHGIKFISLETASDKHVKREVFEQLIHIFRTCEKPILIHDKGGVARTGEVAALWLITQWDPEQIKLIVNRTRSILNITGKPTGLEDEIRREFHSRTETALSQLSFWRYFHIDWLNPKKDFVRTVGNAFAEITAKAIKEGLVNGMNDEEIVKNDTFAQLATFLDLVYSDQVAQLEVDTVPLVERLKEKRE